jgi:hypothetical protein
VRFMISLKSKGALRFQLLRVIEAEP